MLGLQGALRRRADGSSARLSLFRERVRWRGGVLCGCWGAPRGRGPARAMKLAGVGGAPGVGVGVVDERPRTGGIERHSVGYARLRRAAIHEGKRGIEVSTVGGYGVGRVSAPLSQVRVRAGVGLMSCGWRGLLSDGPHRQKRGCPYSRRRIER